MSGRQPSKAEIRDLLRQKFAGGDAIVVDQWKRNEHGVAAAGEPVQKCSSRTDLNHCSGYTREPARSRSNASLYCNERDKLSVSTSLQNNRSNRNNVDGGISRNITVRHTQSNPPSPFPGRAHIPLSMSLHSFNDIERTVAVSSSTVPRGVGAGDVKPRPLPTYSEAINRSQSLGERASNLQHSSKTLLSCVLDESAELV